MKIRSITALLFILLNGHVFSQNSTSLFALSFEDINSKMIDLKRYSGKKIIIIAVDANTPDRHQLLLLDSLVKNTSLLAAIVIPVSDFNEHNLNVINRRLYTDSLPNLLIANVSKAKKINGNKQHPLLQWVSKKEFNRHFDFDFVKPNQMQIINENGEPYANFMEGINIRSAFFKKVLAAK